MRPIMWPGQIYGARKSSQTGPNEGRQAVSPTLFLYLNAPLHGSAGIGGHWQLASGHGVMTEPLANGSARGCDHALVTSFARSARPAFRVRHLRFANVPGKGAVKTRKGGGASRRTVKARTIASAHCDNDYVHVSCRPGTADQCDSPKPETDG